MRIYLHQLFLTRISHSLSVNLDNLSRHLRPQIPSSCRFDNVLRYMRTNLAQHLAQLHSRFCEKSGLARLSHKYSGNLDNLSRHLRSQTSSPCPFDNVLRCLRRNLTQHLAQFPSSLCEKCGLNVCDLNKKKRLRTRSLNMNDLAI